MHLRRTWRRRDSPRKSPAGWQLVEPTSSHEGHAEVAPHPCADPRGGDAAVRGDRLPRGRQRADRRSGGGHPRRDALPLSAPRGPAGGGGGPPGGAVPPPSRSRGALREAVVEHRRAERLALFDAAAAAPPAGVDAT